MKDKEYNSIMFKRKILVYLAILFIISLGLRLYKIDTVPIGIHPDEASSGYNAYSIIKTGKDEHGINHPLIFQAFGDQKLPLYIYTLTPFIKVFGLNNLAVRLPAAISGSLITLAIFFLLRQFGFSTGLSFIGALIAATSPWSIILSRIWGYESNLGLLFFVLGILFFFLAYKKNNFLYLIISSVAFGLTWYCYIAYNLISLLIVLSLVLIYRKDNKFIKSTGVLFLVIFFITVSPFLIGSFLSRATGTIRFNQVISTPNLGMVLSINEDRNYCTQNLPKILCYINSNKLVSYSLTLLSRYIKTFSPNYLFLEGEQDSNFLNINNYGLFYLVCLPFYLAGIIYFWSHFVKKRLSKNEFFVSVGLIISALPALLVNEPQKVRLSGLLPFLVIFLIFGVSQIYAYLKKWVSDKAFYTLIIFSILISVSFFIINFLFIHIDKYEIEYRTYLVRLMRYLGQQDKKTQIYIKPIDEGIILYAYVNKIDPDIFQKLVIRQSVDKVGFAHAIDLQNIHITNKSIYKIYCQTKNNNYNNLYVTNEDLVKTNEVKRVKKIIFSENKVYRLEFIYDTKEIRNKNIDCRSILN